jgi:nitrogenase molybdenum-iron protein alpha chain
MAINLKTSVVESREQRLGSIVGWDGSASELSEASGYSRGDCGGCGSKGKRICEQESPFSQGMSCSEMMVECQAGHIRKAVLVEHSPIGCSAGQVAYNSKFRNALKMRGIPVENTHWICSNLREKDMVYGGVGKLEASVRLAWERHHPQAIFIATSCATAIIGDDVESVAASVGQELGIPVVPLYCEGFKSKHWSTGFDATQHGILRQIVNRHPAKQDDLVNVINLWGSDVFTPMLAQLGLRVNYVVDLATVEDLARLSEAAATIGFCNTLSSYLATALEQEFGVPQVKAPQPYGLAGTDAWLREIGRVTRREDKAEAYIGKEHARIAPRLAELRRELSGVKGFAATGSAYSHGLIAVLREIGVQVDGSLVFHHDPVYDSLDPRQDSLAQTLDEYGEVPFFSVGNRQQYLLPALLRRVHPDFLLIRHNGLAPLAARLGIPAIPLGDEHHPLGYQGLLNMGESIIGILARRRFSKNLAEHVRLPYSKWWLSQDDPYALARGRNAPARKPVQTKSVKSAKTNATKPSRKAQISRKGK